MVAVDVEGAEVGGSADQVNFDLSGWTGFWVVGFWSVVAVGRFASGFVDTDESDMAGFEEPVEVDTAECPVVGVSD